MQRSAYFVVLFLSFGLIPLMLALALAVFLDFHYCFGFLAFPHFSLPQPQPAFSLLLLAWHAFTLSYSNCNCFYGFLVCPCLIVVFAALSQACLVVHSFCCFVVCLLFFAFPLLWFDSSHACSCTWCVLCFHYCFGFLAFPHFSLPQPAFLGFCLLFLFCYLLGILLPCHILTAVVPMVFMCILV